MQNGIAITLVPDDAKARGLWVKAARMYKAAVREDRRNVCRAADLKAHELLTRAADSYVSVGEHRKAAQTQERGAAL